MGRMQSPDNERLVRPATKPMLDLVHRQTLLAMPDLTGDTTPAREVLNRPGFDVFIHMTLVTEQCSGISISWG